MSETSNSVNLRAVTSNRAKRHHAAAPPGGDAPGHRLERLFQPRSVCVVGASERPGSPAAAVLRNLLDGGFAGETSLVNPRHSSVMGLPCVPRVEALAQAADLAVVAVPAPAVAGSLKALAALGTRHVLMPGGLDLKPASGMKHSVRWKERGVSTHHCCRQRRFVYSGGFSLRRCRA